MSALWKIKGLIFNEAKTQFCLLMRIKLLVFCLLFSAFSWGQIAQFNFPSSGSLVVSSKDANVNVSNLSLSSGTIETNITTGNYFPNEPYVEETGGWNAGTQTAAKSYNVTITAAAGYQFTITNIAFRAYSTSAGPSAIGAAIGSTNIFAMNATDSNLMVINQPVSGQSNLTTATIKIQGWLNGSRSSSGSGVFRLDDLVISGIVTPLCTPPSIISGTISALQNCNATTLTFSNPDPNSYWQTSPTGTDFSYPTTASYNVTTDGIYYVRSYNGVDCWSTSYISQTVSVINPISVSNQPIDKNVTVGNNALFSVTATDVENYQWQLSTDGGVSWSNIVGANTSSYTTPSTTLSMHGNSYRVVLTNVCGVVTSVTATLSVQTVTNFKPGELLFVGFDSTGEDSSGDCSGSDDKYYMTSLVNIVPGTEFLIVNSRYEAGAPANVRTNRWYGSGSPTYEDPGVLKFTWNGSTNIPAGAIISFKSGGTLTSTVYDVKINNVITNDFVITANGSCNLASTSPDQIYIMQGTFTAYGVVGIDRYNVFSGKVLFGLTNGVGWIPITAAVSADTTGGTTRQSRLPDDIECFNIELSSGEGVKYFRNDALHVGSKNLLLSAIMNASNWQEPSNNSCLNVTEDFTSPYTANALGKPFTVTSGNSDGYWTGSDNSDWFNCKNWEGLYVPKNTTDVVIHDKTNDPVIGAATAKYPDGAEINNLVINSGSLTMNNANSILNLYGNWTNNAGNSSFVEGIGTVRFAGSTSQLINNVSPEGTEIFYNVILANDFETSISNDLIVNGDLVNNVNKKLVISSNDYVQVGKNVINNGAISIHDDASLVQVDNTGTYSGTGLNAITRKVENLKVFDYVYWSSPQNGAPFTSVPNSRYYEWVSDHANPLGYGYGNWFAPSASTMLNGKGYIFRVPNGNATQTVTFSGNQFNTGIITSPIKKGPYTAASVIPSGVNGVITNIDDNWNLLGNPYPSAIDAVTFALDNSAVLENAEVMLWRHLSSISSSTSSPYYQSFSSNYSSNDYVTYTASGSVPAGAFDGKIASGQAFFVKMKDDVAVPNTANVTFTNSQRNKSYNNSQFFRTSNSKTNQSLEKHRIWLDLVSPNNTATSQMIGYIEGATNADDFLYEAKSSLLSGFQFYSVIDNKHFKIQGRQLPFNDDDVVSLGMIVPVEGKYTIAINTVDGRFKNKDSKIYLEDKVTGNIHDLTRAPYEFTTAKGNHTNRFVLRFTDQRLSDPDNELKIDAIAVYLKNGLVTIKSDNQLIKSYEVYNVLGQLLQRKVAINSLEAEMTDLIQNNQTLIVKIELENGHSLSKKIIF